MVWITNATDRPIPCPSDGCRSIEPGETHVDRGSDHVIETASRLATR